MKNDVVAATAMAAMALQSAMLKALILSGALTGQQAKDAMEDALLMIEQSQGSSPHIQEVHSLARLLIEQALAQPPKSTT